MAELHAWVDESGSHRTKDPNTYILVAALCPEDAMDDVRQTMRPLLKGSSKVHWRTETKHARRVAITEAVRSCRLDHLIVVRNGLDTETTQRPRRAALKRLLRELDQRQVTHAILEARGRADDAKDTQLHEYLRRTQAISGGLHISHVPGPKDPGLWVPDAVCGAVTANRTGKPHYLEMLNDQITMVTIDWTDS